MTQGILLVAHGSARSGPADVLAELIPMMAQELAGEVVPEIVIAPSFLDHSPQTPAKGMQDLAAAGCTSAVVVPLLLGSAYHLRDDLPRQLITQLPTVIAAHLGPDPKVIEALVARLGTPLPRRVVLVASGARAQDSIRESRAAAQLLAERLGVRVFNAYITAVDPNMRTAVAGLRRQGSDLPVLLPYLLAAGLFSDSIAAVADELGVESRPVIGAHPAIASLAVQRFREAVALQRLS